MENSTSFDWTDVACWESEGLLYSEDIEALSFEGKDYIESATISVPIPDNMKSFSVSVKSGSRAENTDTGYITVGFGEGDSAMGFRSNGISSTSYVVTTLGDSENPINIKQGYDNLFVKVETRNPDKDAIDFYFKDVDIKFYSKKGEVDFFGSLTGETFIQTNTEEKVVQPDTTPRFLIAVLGLAVVIGGVIAYKKLKDRFYTL